MYKRPAQKTFHPGGEKTGIRRLHLFRSQHIFYFVSATKPDTVTIRLLRNKIFRFFNLLFYFRKPALPELKAVHFSDGGQQLLWIGWRSLQPLRVKCQGYRAGYYANETNFILLPLLRQQTIRLTVRSLWRKNKYVIRLSEELTANEQLITTPIQTKNIQPVPEHVAATAHIQLPSFTHPVLTFSTISHLENLKYEKGFL